MLLASKKWREDQAAYWSSDKPINISDVENLTELASNLWIGSQKFNLNGSIAQVWCHSEVCNRSDESDGSSDVVEDAVLARDSEAYTHEEKGTESHESGDSPVLQDVSSGNKDDCKMESAHPVASVCSYVYLTCRGIKEHIGVRVQLSGSD